MKNLVYLCVLLAFVSFCSKEKEETGKKFKVAFIARAQADTFAAWLTNSVQKEASKYNNLKVDILDGQGSDEVENALIENSIVNQYDLVIVQPNNGESQRPYVKKLIEAKIPVITTNPRIENLPGSNSVDANPYEQGAVVAKLALEQVPQNAKVVVLNGPPGNSHSTERRRAWQEEFFLKRTDVQIVGENFANWNRDEALDFMEDWVQANSKIDAIIGMNDNMAIGALEATKGITHLKEILVYGVDGTSEAGQLIKQGRMTATSFQNAYELAEKNMSVANDIITGKTNGLVNEDIGNPLITKDNVKFLIDAHEESTK